jgi:altronate dehydratase large subunit
MKGYLREDGSFGVRNYVLVLSSVGCANHVAKKIAENIPSAVAILNSKGCGQIGTSLEIMNRSLINLALNPNVFGTLIVGLGCESTKPLTLSSTIKDMTSKPIEVITIQNEGGSSKAIQRGRDLVSDMVKSAAVLERTDMSLGDLVLATNCGGSDATSGMASNPVIGVVSDAVANAGGTVMLGETTELIGTEEILSRRATSKQVQKNIASIIKNLEQSLLATGEDLRGANPSPGNMRGGLSTLEEKALGGISKGGTSPITQVLRYGERPKKSGLVIMDTPGYDIESISGMVAGGAQVVIFSTGRGTPIGCPIAPVIKVTGNDDTFSCMRENIDYDASSVLTGDKSIQENGHELIQLLIEVCSGKKTASEELGFNDFSIYHNMELWCTANLDNK